MSSLISKEALLDEVLSYFGVDLAYFGKDLQFVQEAIECAPVVTTTEIIRDLIVGKWVECEKVQSALGMSFNECFAIFDFSRTAEWWSIVGETPEERAREGQKITTMFRIKRGVESGGK
jgi:hypothetical protein